MYIGVGIVFGRLFLPKKSTPLFHTRQRRKIDFYYDKASKSTTKRGLTMTVNNGRLRQAINDKLGRSEIMSNNNM